MSDKREFDLTFEQGYFEEDDSLQIHERGEDGEYYLSGADARKFMRNRSDLEVSSKDKDSIHFRDKVTGEIYTATAPDHTLGALILGAIVLLFVSRSIAPAITMVPVTAVCLLWSFPWGPVVLLVMGGVAWWTCRKWGHCREGYPLILLDSAMVLTILSLLVLRFVLKADCLMWSIFLIPSYAVGIVGLIFLWAALFNVLTLLIGIVKRNGNLIRPGLFYLITLPAVTTAVAGVSGFFGAEHLSVHAVPPNDIIRSFLEALPHSGWQWFGNLIEAQLFARGPVAVAAIGGGAALVMLLLNRILGLTHTKKPGPKKKHRK